MTAPRLEVLADADGVAERAAAFVALESLHALADEHARQVLFALARTRPPGSSTRWACRSWART